MKTYKFEVDEEIYEMTMEELAQSITKTFAKEILSKEEFNEFIQMQHEFFEKQREEIEEYARTHYIYDELRDAR